MDDPPRLRYFGPSGAPLASYHSPTDDEPCEYEYTEIFPSGETYHGYSSGGGTYYEHPRAATPGFHVHKDRRRQTITLHVKSTQLQKLFSDSHITHSIPPTPCDDCRGSYNVWEITPKYQFLKRKLFVLHNPFVNSYGNRALALFLRDFLCDHAIFDGLDLDARLENGTVSPTLWQDIQHYKSMKEMRQVGALFDEVGPLDQSGTSTPGSLEPSSSIHNQHSRFLSADVQAMLRRAAKKGDILYAKRVLRENTQIGSSTGLISESCLTLAIKSGRMDIFWLYFNHGASVNSRCEPLWNEPLYTAAKYGQFEAVKALLSRGAKLDGNLYGGCFKSPITGAAAGGHFDIVRFLIECGASIDEVNHSSPLAAAAKHNHIQIVEYLLDCGAIIDGSTGVTPLIAAIRAGNLDIVRLLISRGANVNQSYFPDHPMSPASRRSSGHSVIGFEQLPQICVDRRTPLFFAIITGRVEIANILINHGAQLTEQEVVLSEDLAHSSTISISGAAEFEADVECTFSHALKARQRQRLMQRLRRAVLKNQTNLCDLASAPNASEDLKKFVRAFENSRSNWKLGLEVLQNLLNDQLPADLKQSFSCLQVLDAMRQSAGLDYLDKEFYTDIRRWRLVVPPHEGALFDEILNSLWDINTSSSQPPLPPDDALLYFQRLVTNLISKDDVSHLLELTFDSGGRKLDEIRDEYAPTDNLDIFFAENTLLLPSKYSQQNEHHERDPPILKHWKPASPKVVYLMATAVFTTFIIFMLVFKTVVRAGTLTSFFRRTEETLAPLNRYAVVLFIYLGLGCSDEGRPSKRGSGKAAMNPPSSAASVAGTSNPDDPVFEGAFMPEGSNSNPLSLFSSDGDEDNTSDADESSAGNLPTPVTLPNVASPNLAPVSTLPSGSIQSGPLLQCPQCQKTFKTVGNRNKHLKTNCRLGTQDKLPCRNRGCTRMLKGEWYRRTHEQERCRFRSVQ